MATEAPEREAPDWAVAPGEVLVEALADRGMSQSELARRMARPQKTINEIATGRAAITPETAIGLERTLGISAALWIGLESRYREALARQRAADELDGFVAWARTFPIKELARQGLIQGSKDLRVVVAQLLTFFGVSNPDGWERHWREAVASYRMSPSAAVSVPALTAWLRWAEILAERSEGPQFDLVRLAEAMRRVRALTQGAVLSLVIDDLVAELAPAGVVVVVLPTLPGAPASGAARWHAGRGIMLLTLRYLRDDQFWYSVGHEIGHFATGRRGRSVFEAIDAEIDADDVELAADRFARDWLIPPEDYERFTSNSAFDRRSVRDFAIELGIASGIVVGRLQHDGYLEATDMNDLKIRYERA
jgi:HTH-type transcriptional regulator/antitoxin HigA